MIAELLDELTPQLVRHLEARIAAASEPELAPGRYPRELSSALLRQLIRTLRQERIDVSLRDSELSIGVDVEPYLRTLRLVKECTYGAIKENGHPTTLSEMSLVGDWFCAMTERALRAANRRVAAMIDALPDPLFLQDAEGRFVYLNRHAADLAMAMSGLPHDALVGSKFLDLDLPEGFAEYIRAVTARVLSGESVKDELFTAGSDGGHWRAHELAPVFDTNGKVEAIAVASRDIHARKVAEARLQLLSKVGMLLETIEFEGVLTGVAHLSIPELADWCIIDVVENGQVRLGGVAHRDPAKVALAEEILQSSPEPSALSLGQSVFSGGSLLMGEVDEAEMRERDPRFYRVVRRLGARSAMIVPFVVLGAPIAVATFVFTPDSGRRHGPQDLALAEEMARRAAQMIENARLHEQLRQSESRFRVALAHSKIAVFEEDTDLRIRWMHNIQLGIDDRAAIGKTMAEFLLTVEAATELDALKRRVLESGKGEHTAVDAVVRGERRHLLINYEPRRAVGGIIGITGAAVDITEAKKVQEELAQALAFRERMMGVLGHDLRNPLSAVLALSGLLQRQDTLPDKTREDIRQIEQAAIRMREMIGTLLDFTQLRFRGGLPLSIEPVELGVVARAVVDELRAAHPSRAIRIDAKGELRGQWDAGRIAQVVSNLASNALVHGAREAPVEVALSSEESQVVVEVTNRGPAIPEALVGRLFEPFQQGPDHGDAPRSRGLGLGLFIVREIVHAHGGTIEVRSRDGVTVFTVRLPRVAN